MKASATPSTDQLLSAKEVIREYPIFGSASSLAERRWRGDGPDYIKTSEGRAGRVFYRRSAIEKWLDARTVSGGQAA
ncbi:DNA-binding protein [Streptomyces sp. NPDC005408]|uniref:helix-turn-helix transcriptional regulator n=1 Tax=Streptomyces sp. NPDC005408 TaxID=3155341 RepID=UPI0033B1438C